jgi:CBS domain containing-hemolysin-like protein
VIAVTTADLALLASIGVLVVLATFLSMAETALGRVSRARAESLVDEERKGAKALEWLASHRDLWLTSLLFTLLTCQIVQAVLVGIVANRLSGSWWVVALVTAADVAVVFVIAEAAPTTWALQHTERAALLAARPVRFLALLPPLRFLAGMLIWLTNVLIPGKGLKAGPYVTEEEILALAEAAVADEVIEEEERELIESIIEFGDTVVREVMVPRTDMVTVDRTFRIGDALEVMLLNGFSRIPVCGDSIEDVVGLIIAKDLMRADRDGRGEETVDACLRPVRLVPETKRVAELLPEMQAEQIHMAVVVDEYGGTAGLVTLEDVIEELVGEIVDEFDNEEAMIEPAPGGDVRVRARMPVDELNELLAIALPEGDWDTVGGLLLHELGHLPVEGETVEIQGHTLRAERVQGRRIGRVRVTIAAADREPDTAGNAG